MHLYIPQVLSIFLILINARAIYASTITRLECTCQGNNQKGYYHQYTLCLDQAQTKPLIDLMRNSRKCMHERHCNFQSQSLLEHER